MITLVASIGVLGGCSNAVTGSPRENAADVKAVQAEAADKAATAVCDAVTTGHAGISAALDRKAPSPELADAIQNASDSVKKALTPKVPDDLRPVMEQYVTAAADMARAFRTFEEGGDKIIDKYFDTLKDAEDACAERE
ncbi:MAG: hypothetical protein LLG14_22455 [Nocardiaceae bacterium]|nr:hypothetical protein [Nocardiaceae bacterium]